MMNHDYLCEFMDITQYPAEAREAILNANRFLQADEVLKGVFERLDVRVNAFGLTTKEALECVKTLTDAAELEEYTFAMLFMMRASERLRERYRNASIPEELFWHTMEDFRYKIAECHEMTGQWGNRSGAWQNRYFIMSTIAIGRFLFEKKEFKYERYEKAGLTIHQGDLVYSLHIPSSGMPFDRQARLDSYKRAYEYYQCKQQGKPLLVVCHSWLLYPGQTEFLPQNSNILDFMKDFDIIDSEERDEFQDSWRVFGRASALPPQQWPRDTSLRRAYAERVCNGGKTGLGYGVLFFDGERIINQ